MMKQFFTLLLLAVAMFFVSTSTFAQCTPDTSLTAIGLYPDSLPDGVVGQPYNEVIFATLPTDTTLLGVTFAFCSYRIVSITPDPSTLGLSYSCDQPNCNYTVDHTLGKPLKFGCVTLSGTPTTTVDSLVVTVEANIGTVIGGVCNVSAPLNIPYTVAFKITGGSNSLADVFSSRAVALQVAPNPVQAAGELRFSLPQGADIQAEILDITGRQVVAPIRAGYLAAGEHALSFNMADLPAGMYLARLSVDGGAAVVSGKFLVQP
ncbi:MAG: T9SS type A sorting domain-containing protein [Bacteroidia bacterium]|nr:T9SS type A sorting domain-containing protein [Bacteroidia bacterium]